MQRKEYTDNQIQIFQDLLESSYLEFSESPEKVGESLVVGAHETVFTYRNAVSCISAGAIARAVLPVDDEMIQPLGLISQKYDFESLFSHDVFELHSFCKGESAVLVCKKGERSLFCVSPDCGSEGLLLRLEWDTPLERNLVLTPNDAVRVLRKVFRRWNDVSIGRPEVWVNGSIIKY